MGGRKKNARSDSSSVELVSLPVKTASVALAILTVLPIVHVIPFYLNMILQASLTVFIGCYMSVHDGSEEETSQRESLSKKDVMRFPVVGSIALCSLYVGLKYSKDLVNILLLFYFMLLGVAAVASLYGPLIQKHLPGSLSSPKKFSYVLPVIDKLEFTAAEAVCGVVGAVLAVIYGVTKYWLVNNIFGIAFSLMAIKLLSIGSFLNSAILLGGLFFYDIFWVFGTEVMVTVAKGFEGPIKLVFPRNFNAPIEKRFSMLGLGDIVIPALCISLLLRWDVARQRNGQLKQRSFAYFFHVWGAYVLGLVATVVVMLGFDAAQPALLYLVPAVLGSAFLVAAQRGEVSQLIAYKEKEEDAAALAAAAAEPWFVWPWQSKPTAATAAASNNNNTNNKKHSSSSKASPPSPTSPTARSVSPPASKSATTSKKSGSKSPKNSSSSSPKASSPKPVASNSKKGNGVTNRK